MACYFVLPENEGCLYLNFFFHFYLQCKSTPPETIILVCYLLQKKLQLPNINKQCYFFFLRDVHHVGWHFLPWWKRWATTWNWVTDFFLRWVSGILLKTWFILMKFIVRKFSEIIEWKPSFGSSNCIYFWRCNWQDSLLGHNLNSYDISSSQIELICINFFRLNQE